MLSSLLVLHSNKRLPKIINSSEVGIFYLPGHRPQFNYLNAAKSLCSSQTHVYALTSSAVVSRLDPFWHGNFGVLVTGLALWSLSDLHACSSS